MTDPVPLLRQLAFDAKALAVRSAVAEAMNNTSTNPTPQAQYLASEAAKAGFEEGIVAAMAVFADMRQFTNSVEELGKPYLDELDRFLDRVSDEQD